MVGKLRAFTPSGGATDNRPPFHRHVRLRSSRCESPIQRRLPTREIGGVLVRIGLLTDGGYPYATGESRLWCDRLVRGLAQHEFDIYALSRSARQEGTGWIRLPPSVQRVRTAPLWSAEGDGRAYGRRERRRFTGHFGDLITAVCTPDGQAAGSAGDDDARSVSAFAEGLYGLAELAREHGGLATALRSEAAVRILEAACHAPGARRSVRGATVPDYLVFADQLERAAPALPRLVRRRRPRRRRPLSRDNGRIRRPAGASGQTLLRGAAAGHRVRRPAPRPLPGRRTRR